jgi:hypothetical protein
MASVLASNKCPTNLNDLDRRAVGMSDD